LVVSQDPRNAEFIEKALTAGMPHQSLVGVLAANGWSEKEIYGALADHYGRQTGIAIPRRTGAGASSKEAFLYLLIFATLATWTLGLGQLAFALIERWMADPLFNGYQQASEAYAITMSLAKIIVAFPFYLLISRTVVRDTRAHPEKLDSSIRKWLTYLALVIAAAIFMGDLIAALDYLLRGELTLRFIGKWFTVGALSGGVFYYYFGGLRKTDAATQRPSRDKLMALLSSAVVAVMLVLGFSQLGTPSGQRELRADSQRVSHLYRLSTFIGNYWSTHASQLPSGLDQLTAVTLADPITRAPYGYHPRQGSKYELCATFARSSDRSASNSGPNPWTHLAGHQCFTLDATVMAQTPSQYFGN
jgi:hypothetical protein